jgi:hypothetical protein
MMISIKTESLTPKAAVATIMSQFQNFNNSEFCTHLHLLTSIVLNQRWLTLAEINRFIGDLEDLSNELGTGSGRYEGAMILFHTKKWKESNGTVPCDHKAFRYL